MHKKSERKFLYFVESTSVPFDEKYIINRTPINENTMLTNSKNLSFSPRITYEIMSIMNGIKFWIVWTSPTGSVSRE